MYIPLQAQGFDVKSLMPFALMFIVLYLFMIRPQIKKQKNEKKFQSELTKGKKVITTSGIHGKIAEVNDNDNTVTIETGAGKIKMEKSAVSLDLTKKLESGNSKA